MDQDMRVAFAGMLVDLGRADSRLVVLDADLNTSVGTDAFAREFPARFVECGIAEQNMAGIAAGIATTRRLIPLVATFGVFASRRIYDQVSVSIAYPRLNVKIIGASSGLTSAPGGASHQALEDLALMRAMPNMTVIDPGDNTELRSVLETMVLSYDGPVYIRAMRCAPRPIVPAGYAFQRGRAVLLQNGDDVTLVGTGIMTMIALDAARLLAAEGITSRVIHVPCLKPLDEETLVAAALATRAMVTLENHSVIGGLGGAVAEVLAERCPIPLRRVGTADVFGRTGPMDALFASFGLTAERAAAAARQVITDKDSCARMWRSRKSKKRSYHAQ